MEGKPGRPVGPPQVAEGLREDAGVDGLRAFRERLHGCLVRRADARHAGGRAETLRKVARQAQRQPVRSRRALPGGEEGGLRALRYNDFAQPMSRGARRAALQGLKRKLSPNYS